MTELIFSYTPQQVNNFNPTKTRRSIKETTYVYLYTSAMDTHAISHSRECNCELYLYCQTNSQLGDNM
jgi:hypothetical protein